MAREHAIHMHGAAAHYVDQLRQRGRVAFSLRELEQATGLSTIAARRQLARLGRRIVRVMPRQPFFVIVDPEHQALGAPPPAWWLDAYFRWLRRPYYLALQSAAAEHGSSVQAIQVTQVMTDAPRRDIVLGRVRVQFFVKRDVRSTPTQAPAQAFAPLALSTPEATVIDLVRYAQRIGGIERVAETILPLLPRLKRPQLAEALGPSPQIPTLQRLGYLFDALGKPGLASTVRAGLTRALKPVPLDTGANLHLRRKPILDERWSVLVNASIKALL